jgi:hypothetical protein
MVERHVLTAFRTHGLPLLPLSHGSLVFGGLLVERFPSSGLPKNWVTHRDKTGTAPHDSGTWRLLHCLLPEDVG